MDGGSNGVPILRCVAVTKRFGGVTANDAIDLKVDGNEVVGLIGPNGSGKTTFLNVIAGLYAPDSGKVWFHGTSIGGKSPSQVCRLGIARTFQLLRLFHGMTVTENAMFGAFVQTTSVKGAREMAARHIAYVGLEDKASDLASTLSTGMRKRLELARALATDPQLILLDEVLAGVDPGNRQPLVALLERLKKDGRTIIMVEHSMEVLSRTCDRLVALDEGHKVSEGPPTEVLTDLRVARSYLGQLRA